MVILDKNDIEIKDNGKIIELDGVSKKTESANVVLMLDMSGSVQSKPVKS